jgi:hypothetical protein
MDAVYTQGIPCPRVDEVAGKITALAQTSTGKLVLASCTPTIDRLEAFLTPQRAARVEMLVVAGACPKQPTLFVDLFVRALRRQAFVVLATDTPACWDVAWKAANAKAYLVRRTPPDPPDTATVAAEQRGYLVKLVYPTGFRAVDVAASVLTAWAPNWIADGVAPRGTVPAATQQWVAGAVGLGIGALLASWWRGRKR